MEMLKRKLSRTKLWAAAAGLVMGLGMVFGLDETIANTIAGAVVAVASVVSYIVAEGRIDAAAVGEAAGKVQDAIDAVTGEEE